MPIKDLPFFGQYNVQQFTQFVPEDVANWSLMQNESAKKGMAFYPQPGRKNIRRFNRNILQFNSDIRRIRRSANFLYVFEGTNVWRYSRNFSETQLVVPDYVNSGGQIYFAYLPTPSFTLVVWTDGSGMWVHNENSGTVIKVTDFNMPSNPGPVVAFGNRIAVAKTNSNQFALSKTNLGGLFGSTENVDPATCFTVNGSAVFAFETGNIVNFAVLHNTLYTFQEFVTGIWSNTPSVFGTPGDVTVRFPWRKNTTYDFDYGLAEPYAMDYGFGMMTWMGQNADGLVQIVTSSGQQPQPISTSAIDLLLERDIIDDGDLSPFLERTASGFMYQRQNIVYFRLSAGETASVGIQDGLLHDGTRSLEYSFATKTWSRCTEIDGTRNKVQQHVYFANRHLVTAINERTIYQLSDQIFTNGIRDTTVTDNNSTDAYINQPFRYERITQSICEPDFGEFETDFVQIDFVWGYKTYNYSVNPFPNTVYIVDESGTFLETETGGELIIADGSDYPVIGDTIYRNWFKPHIELWFSDDGGVSWHSADVLEFSQLGVYQWRMRWYQLGCSRNRSYKLIAVSPAPIVPLGAIMDVRRVSGGAA